MKRSLLIIITLLVIGIQDMHAQYTWIPKTNFTPGNRAGAFYFSIGSFGYVGAGVYQVGNNIVYINDFWQYDPVSDAWTQKSNIPGNGVSSPASFSIGQYGYIATGYDATTYLNQTLQYDPVANQWSGVANFPGTPRYTTASFVINNEAYVGMGKSGGYYSDFYKYNPGNNMWSTIASIPGPARQSARGFSINGYGYVVGGADGTVDYASLYQYDPVSDSWSQKSNYPGLGRYGTAALVLNGIGLVGTGSIQTTSNNTFSDFYSYDSVTDSWSPFLSFAGGIRNSTSFFVIGNKAYMGLGSTGVYPVVNYQQDWWELANTTGINEANSCFPVKIAIKGNLITFFLSSQVTNKINLTIFDLSGKAIVSSVDVKNNSVVIDLGSSSKGVYLYSLNSGDHLISGKFITY